MGGFGQTGRRVPEIGPGRPAGDAGPHPGRFGRIRAPGDFKTAASLLEKLGAGQNKLGQQGIFLLAESKRQLGDRNAARRGFEAARKVEGPYQSEAQFRLGFLAFEDRNFDLAIRLLEEFKRNHPKAPNAALADTFLGRAYLEKKNIARAKALLAKIDSAEALFWRARCAQRENKPDEAIKLAARR